MHLIDQVGCTTAIEFIASAFKQLKKIANRKCIGPEVALLIFWPGTGQFGLRTPTSVEPLLRLCCPMSFVLPALA